MDYTKIKPGYIFKNGFVDPEDCPPGYVFAVIQREGGVDSYVYDPYFTLAGTTSSFVVRIPDDHPNTRQIFWMVFDVAVWA